MKLLTIIFVVLSFALLSGCDDDNENGLTDDWQYTPSESSDYMAKSANAGAAPAADMGFAVGGANDINNFRANIENGYLPLPSDITYEGLFYDYYFDTGDIEECSDLFCPTYTQMSATDPLTGEVEHFLSVGLASGMSASDFSRKKLNLMVVLDISGSMSSQFNHYYYDSSGNPQPQDEEISDKSKMATANESVAAMLDHLKAGDRFGMVLFDDEAYLAKPMNLVETTDMAAIKDHILEIEPDGGTHMEAGYEKAARLFDEFNNVDHDVYENRIIFLTDAMPNTGETDEGSLLGMVKSAASDDVYTTFIGVGIDFNTALINAITKVRGANYYSVHSETAFKKRMDEEFEFMVTPLVFDLTLRFESTGYEINAVYGSPEADEATGELMKVNTLFPSKSEAGESKGGIVILKLTPKGEGADIKLTASYTDRASTLFTTEKSLTYDSAIGDSPDVAIRKGVLLARYARLMQTWLTHTWELVGEAPDPSSWERQSEPLTVSAEYKELFTTFSTAFASERAAISDDDLIREEAILGTLIDWPTP